jgi:hypothetical protein
MSVLLLGLDSRATMPDCYPPTAMSAISSAMPMAVIIRRCSMIACCSGLKGTSKAELHVLRVPPQRRHSQQGRGDLCRGLRIRLTGDLRSSVAEEARLEDISPLYEATRAGSAFPGQTVSQRVKRGRDQSHLQALTQERPAHQAQLLTTTPLQPSS